MKKTLCFCLLNMVCALARATTYRVTPAAGAGDGSSWGNPMTLTSAISTAVAGDEIWMKEGVYALAATLSISKGIAVYGGFAGTEASPGDRAGGATALDGSANKRVMTASVAAGATMLLDRITIRNGKKTDSTQGVGLYKSGAGTLAMVDCTVTNNLGSHYGVGVYSTSGTTALTNCVFSKNGYSGTRVIAGQGGFGLYASSTSLILEGCRFEGHGTSGGIDGSGQTLVINACANALVQNTRFIGNYGPGNVGIGGIVALSGNCSGTVLRNCLLANTSGTGNAQYGFGIYVAMDNASRTLAIENCTFAKNAHSSGSGGVVSVNTGAVTIRNSIFWGNTVPAGVNGADVYRVVSANNSVVIDRCSFPSLGVANIVDSSGTQTLTIQKSFVADPLFVDSANRDYHLMSAAGHYAAGSWVTDAQTSPCIDAGDPASAFALELGPNGGRVNLGFYGNTAEASKSVFNLGSAVTIEDVGCQTAFDRTKIRFRGQLASADPSAAGTVSLCFGAAAPEGDTEVGWDHVIYMSGNQPVGGVFTNDTDILPPGTTYAYRWHVVNGVSDNWTAVGSVTSGSILGTGGGFNVIHVDPGATGAGDGYDWADAFTSYKDALLAVTADRREIWLKSGTIALDATVAMVKGATIRGGFAGTESAAAERAPGATTTLNGVKAYRAFSASIPSGDSAELERVAVSNCVQQAVLKSGSGTLTIRDSVVGYISTADNVAGIGLNISGGTTLITNCTVRNIKCTARTTTGNNGVGLYASGSAVQIIDTDFYNNQALDGSATMCAAAFCLSGCANAVVSGCVVTNNSILGSIGGSTVMLDGNSGGTAFRNCLIARNKQTGTGYAAGTCWGVAVDIQMDTSARTCTVENCTVAYNDGKGTFGGAFYVKKGVLNLRNSILHGNTLAYGYGGNNLYVASVDASVVAAYDCLSSLASPAVIDSTGASPSRVTFVSAAGVATCFAADPLFVNAGGDDFHLKSAAGHWDPAAPGGWTTDPGETSPCIDAGDPVSDGSREPPPNGSRVNMGAFANTPQASKSAALVAVGVANLGADTGFDGTRVRFSAQVTGAAGGCGVATLFWGTESVPGETAEGWQNAVGLGSRVVGAAFSSDTLPQAPNTVLYYRWRVENALGVSWSDIFSCTAAAEPAPGGGAGVVHVKTAACGVADGSDWNNAVGSLAEALSQATLLGRTTIWAQEGDYGTTQLAIPAGVSVYGGFAGTECAYAERPVGTRSNTGRFNVSLSSTKTNIVDGLDVNALGTSRGSWICLNLSGNGAFTAANCTLRKGRGDQYDGNGMVLNSQGGNVIATVTNCVIRDCYAEYNGGSGRWIRMTHASAQLHMFDCVVSNYTSHTMYAYDNYGCIRIDNGLCHIERTEFVKNAIQVGGSAGAIVHVSGNGRAVLRNCLFANTTGSRWGSNPSFGVGVYINNGSATITNLIENCTFVNNSETVETSPCAIGVNKGVAVVRNCIFNGNSKPAGSNGKDVYVSSADGKALVSYSAFESATATNLYDAGGGSGLVLGGVNRFGEDPLFVDVAKRDYHLRSRAGHWNVATQAFVADAEDSPFLDAGDPASDYSREVKPNGGRINLGAYGGTQYASRTVPRGTVLLLK